MSKIIEVDIDALMPAHSPLRVAALRTWRRLIRDDVVPPITVVRAGNEYMIVDGQHRAFVQIECGLTKLKAICVGEADYSYLGRMRKSCFWNLYGKAGFESLPIVSDSASTKQLDLGPL